jgi:plastocyanin
VYFDRPNLMVPLLTVRDAPMSYDPQTGYFYVMGIVSPRWFRRLENPVVVVSAHPPYTKEYGIFAAIDSRTNKIVWQRRSPWGLAGGSGALTTAGGLLFHVEGDGNLQANDARTGKALWQFQMGLLGAPASLTLAGGCVPVATYESEGEQYIAVPIGNGLWTFKLGGTLLQRPAPTAPPQEYGFVGLVHKLADDGTAEIQIGAVSMRAEHVVDEYAFVPSRARAKAGISFKWTNYGVKNHSIVSADGSFTTGEILPGQSVTISLPKRGSYTYYSKEFPWSKGQLIVQ